MTCCACIALVAGVEDDGSPKIRPVDDLTRSSCNAATSTFEKLEYESLDKYLALVRLMGARVSKDLESWKNDIKSAFRRIPILPEHRQFAVIAFKIDGKVLTAKHLALCFGAIASVTHWERIGDLLKAIARRILHIPVLRHVTLSSPSCCCVLAWRTCEKVCRRLLCSGP